MTPHSDICRARPRRAGLVARLADKVAAGERLGERRRRRFCSSPTSSPSGAMADFARARDVGDDVYFIANRHINHTNVCRNRCLFCAFSHDDGDADAFTLSVDQVRRQGPRDADRRHHRDPHRRRRAPRPAVRLLPRDDARPASELAPDVHIQAFTASEVGPPRAGSAA